MFLIGIFASPIPYLAILGIYLWGFVCIKFWPAGSDDGLPVEVNKTQLSSSVQPYLSNGVPAAVYDFDSNEALPPLDNLARPGSCSVCFFPELYLSPPNFFWPSQPKVRPPPAG